MSLEMSGAMLHELSDAGDVVEIDEEIDEEAAASVVHESQATDR